jgi:hypothetical protein
MAISPDGGLLASGDRTLRLWRIAYRQGGQ